MPDLTQTQMLDIGTATLSRFRKKKLVDLAMTQQKYHFVPNLLKKRRIEETSGKDVRFYALVDLLEDTARNVGYYAEQVVQDKDVLAEAAIPWRRTIQQFSADKFAMAQNEGDAQIIRMFGAKRAAAYGGLIKRIETDGWGKPASSSDVVTPYGIKCYIVKKITGTSATTGEFGGLNPTGFSSGVGFNSTTYATWANYTRKWAAITPDDSVQKIHEAISEMNWDTPLAPYMGDKLDGRPDLVIYMEPSSVYQHEALANKQNDNAGGDLFKYAGRTFINGHPLVAVNDLTADADDPIYLIDWGAMGIQVMRGYNLIESQPFMVAGYIDVIGVVIQLGWNMYCYNRRRQGVLAKAANNP